MSADPGNAEHPRRVVVDAPGSVSLEEFELPALPPAGHARVRVDCVGICGSDLHVLAGHHPFVSYPVLPGHEVAGRVVALGEGTDDSLLGKPVALEPSLYCGNCRTCQRGDYNICEKLRVMGFQAPGAMADRFDAPVKRLHVLPEALPSEVAVLAEPTAVAVRAVRLLRPSEGQDVVVIGAGTIGILCAQVARSEGAEALIVETDPQRRDLARQSGFTVVAEAPSSGFDVAFECVGNEGALRGAVGALRKGGRLGVVGVYGDDVRVQTGLIQDRELLLQGVLMYTSADFTRAIELLGEGAVDSGPIVGASFDLSDAEEAYTRAAGGGDILKVLLRP